MPVSEMLLMRLSWLCRMFWYAAFLFCWTLQPVQLAYLPECAHMPGTPCAWLESGGFWSSDVAIRLTGRKRPILAEQRCQCPEKTVCETKWLRSPKSLAFRWTGTFNIHSYVIQMHFCKSVNARTCGNSDVVAFILKQSGMWISLEKTNCKCARDSLGDVFGFRYSKPQAAKDTAFRGVLIDMTCKVQKTCGSSTSACYLESVNAAGLVTGGKVMCRCPQGSYCPIYHVNSSTLNRRRPVNGTDGKVEGYKLHCRPEPKSRIRRSRRLP